MEIHFLKKWGFRSLPFIIVRLIVGAKNKFEMHETIIQTSDKFLDIDLWSVVYFLDLCFNILIVFDHMSLTLRLNIVVMVPRWMTFDC